MRTYVDTKTSDLKSGMVVYMHGSDFTVTADAVESRNFPGVYTAKCEIVTPLASGHYMEILNDYDYFQGNDLALWSVVVIDKQATI